jgi:hypothetical protein
MSSASDPGLLVIASVLADLCFPGICVVALYRSFLAGFLVHPRLPVVMRNLLTCPLCLGFHLTWIWMCVRCFVMTPPMHYPVLDWVMFPITGAVIAYAFENTFAVLSSFGTCLDTAQSAMSTVLPAPEQEPMTIDEEIEEARRGC